MNTTQLQKKLLSIQEHMMHFALSLTANKDDAKDLMQDTTLRVLKNQDKFVSNINFKGWVLTIMHHIFLNDRNKNVKLQTIIDPSTDLYNLDVAISSSYATPEGEHTLKEITKAINSLEEELKMPFILSVIQGYQYNEIAEKLDLTMPTVKNRIHRARLILQDYLKDFR